MITTDCTTWRCENGGSDTYYSQAVCVSTCFSVISCLYLFVHLYVSFYVTPAIDIRVSTGTVIYPLTMSGLSPKHNLDIMAQCTSAMRVPPTWQRSATHSSTACTGLHCMHALISLLLLHTKLATVQLITPTQCAYLIRPYTPYIDRRYVAASQLPLEWLRTRCSANDHVTCPFATSGSQPGDYKSSMYHFCLYE